MRQYLALFIFLVFFGQPFSSLFIVADYFSNTASYAKNCENKAKPAMHCNGKCQMMKKIQQQENKGQQNSERRYENKNEVLSSKSFFPVLSIIINSIEKKYFAIKIPCSTNHAAEIFHPPQYCNSI
ncbi:MAG TPA: hypothetical protein VIM07_16220 [Chitinophagaceae bacterium]